MSDEFTGNRLCPSCVVEVPSRLNALPECLTGRKLTQWTVATTKNLEPSNTFFFNPFYNGDIGPVAARQ